jgi:hypothetical protein
VLCFVSERHCVGRTGRGKVDQLYFRQIPKRDAAQSCGSLPIECDCRQLRMRSYKLAKLVRGRSSYGTVEAALTAGLPDYIPKGDPPSGQPQQPLIIGDA